MIQLSVAVLHFEYICAIAVPRVRLLTLVQNLTMKWSFDWHNQLPWYMNEVKTIFCVILYWFSVAVTSQAEKCREVACYLTPNYNCCSSNRQSQSNPANPLNLGRIIVPDFGGLICENFLWIIYTHNTQSHAHSTAIKRKYLELFMLLESCCRLLLPEYRTLLAAAQWTLRLRRARLRSHLWPEYPYSAPTHYNPRADSAVV